MYTNSSKDIPNNKEAKNSRGSREHFQAFLLLQIVPNSRFLDLSIKKEGKCTIQVRRKDILLRIRLRLTIVVISFTKSAIRKEEDMTIYSIYKKNHPVTPKQIVNVLDLGFLGV